MLANEIREMTLSLPHHDPISGSATLSAIRATVSASSAKETRPRSGRPSRV